MSGAVNSILEVKSGRTEYILSPVFEPVWDQTGKIFALKCSRISVQQKTGGKSAHLFFQKCVSGYSVQNTHQSVEDCGNAS